MDISEYEVALERCTLCSSRTPMSRLPDDAISRSLKPEQGPGRFLIQEEIWRTAIIDNVLAIGTDERHYFRLPEESIFEKVHEKLRCLPDGAYSSGYITDTFSFPKRDKTNTFGKKRIYYSDPDYPDSP